MESLRDDSSFDPFNVDVQLIAAVQAHAGARCHEAGNLLAAYELWTVLHRQAVAAQRADEARESRNILDATELDLRRLLYRCRRTEFPADAHPPRDGSVGSDAPPFPGHEPHYSYPA